MAVESKVSTGDSQATEQIYTGISVHAGGRLYFVRDMYVRGCRYRCRQSIVRSLMIVRADCSCGMFRPEDFLAFEYLDDLWFHGFDGPGSRFSAALGYDIEGTS